jgi:hypothetical protein
MPLTHQQKQRIKAALEELAREKEMISGGSDEKRTERLRAEAQQLRADALEIEAL